MTAVILQFVPMARHNKRTVAEPPNRIRELRDAQKLTQKALGELVDMLPGEVSRLETGERPLDVPKLYRFARALGVSAGELLPLRDQGPSEEERLTLEAMRSDARVRRIIANTARELLAGPDEAAGSTAA